MGGEKAVQYAHLPSRTYCLQPTVMLQNGLVSYMALNLLLSCNLVEVTSTMGEFTANE